MGRKPIFPIIQAREGHFVCDGTGFRGVQQILDAAERTKSPQPWRRGQGQGQQQQQ